MFIRVYRPGESLPAVGEYAVSVRKADVITVRLCDWYLTRFDAPDPRIDPRTVLACDREGTLFAVHHEHEVYERIVADGTRRLETLAEHALSLFLAHAPSRTAEPALFDDSAHVPMIGYAWIARADGYRYRIVKRANGREALARVREYADGWGGSYRLAGETTWHHVFSRKGRRFGAEGVAKTQVTLAASRHMTSLNRAGVT